MARAIKPTVEIDKQGSQKVKPFFNLLKNKKCYICRRVSSINDFHVSPYSEDKHKGECKECSKLLDFYKHIPIATRREIIREKINNKILSGHRDTMDCYEDCYV